jgi:hypothetical protein
MTNGFVVGRSILKNIISMKWESQNEKRQDFCGLDKSKIFFHEEKC